jgi:hypothetical protein
MSKQFDLTVTIRVTVPDLDGIPPFEAAKIIADYYAGMAMKYKSVGADEIVNVSVKETENA